MAPTEVTEKQIHEARLLLSWGVVQSILGETRPSTPADLIDVLEQNVYNNIKQCEEWTVVFLKDLIALKTDMEQINNLNDHMKDYLTQSFRQRYVSLSSTPTARGKPYSVHISVMRKLSPELSRNLRLEGTQLLDHLYQCDALSDADRQSILAHPTDKRKNEAFIDYICANFTTETFAATVLPLLSKDEIHADLAAKIETELAEASALSGPLVCTSCQMKGLVQPRKLSEALYKQRAIPESLKRDLCLSTQPTSSRWEEIFKHVSKEDLLQALKKTYPHLYWKFEDTGHSVFECCCYNLVKCDIAQMSDISSDYNLLHADQRADQAISSDASTITMSEDDARIPIDPISPREGTNERASLQQTTTEFVSTSNTGEQVSVKSTHARVRPSTDTTPSTTQTETTSLRSDGGGSSTGIHNEDRDIRDDKAEIQRLKKEYAGLEESLAKESIPLKIQEIKGKLSSTKRLTEQRKQLLALAEERKQKTEEIRGRIAQYQSDYDQSGDLFRKVTASRLLGGAKKELVKLEEDYAEKRRKLESSCVLM